MRKFNAIATIIAVGVLSLFGMSHFAYASVVFDTGDTNDTWESTFWPRTGLVADDSDIAWLAQPSDIVDTISWKIDFDEAPDWVQITLYDNSYGSSPSTPEQAFSEGRGCYTPELTGDFSGGIIRSTIISCDFSNMSGTDSMIMKVDTLDQDETAQVYYVGSFRYYVKLENTGISDTSTRFISVTPIASSTVATTTATTTGADLYVNDSDFIEDKTYLRLSFYNQTAALGGGSVLEAFNSAFGEKLIEIPSSGSILTVSTSTLFNISIGKTYGTYQIITRTCPWYGLGVFCTTNILVSTTTIFYVGEKTGFDISQEAGDLGIFGLTPGTDAFNGTTTNFVLDCALFDPSFAIDKCLWSFIIPRSEIMRQDIENFEKLPIFGVPLRVLDIVWNTTATTSLPIIDYTFSENNSFVGGVRIYFNPWQYMYVSGSFIEQAVSDSGGGDVWDIMSPIINIIVYMTLGFMILRRLTGLNWGKPEWTESETINVSDTVKSKDGQTRTTHTFTKRRKL